MKGEDALTILECANAKYRLGWSDSDFLELAVAYIDSQGTGKAFKNFVEDRATKQAEALDAEERSTHPLSVSFEDWCEEVDRLFDEKTSCNWADLCGDEGPREDAYKEGETPGQFVRWWCQKYDLG